MTVPLETDAIRIQSVQFVGTNVEMRYLVRLDADASETEAWLAALLGEKLGLYAITPIGQEGDEHLFSVMASPLDRLFHKIGPSQTLTLIKHYAEGLNMSEAQLERTFAKLLEDGKITAPESRLKPWDAGKALAFLTRHVEQILITTDELQVMGKWKLEVSGDFPIHDLSDFPQELAHTDGLVTISTPQAVLDTLQKIVRREE